MIFFDNFVCYIYDINNNIYCKIDVAICQYVTTIFPRGDNIFTKSRNFLTIEKFILDLFKQFSDANPLNVTVYFRTVILMLSTSPYLQDH